MKFRIIILLAIITVFGSQALVSAQVDSVIGQVSSSPVAASFANGISGDGRFIVFESIGNLATENPRNTDGNREIFLFDYAQRRIFQITDTKSLLINPANPIIASNIKVDIVNVRPTISHDGRWIAFGSNATTARPDDKDPNTTNPGSFDANSFTDEDGDNILTEDGNTEMWLYQVPMTTPVNLSLGFEIPLTDLSTGTFTRATNTFPTVLPAPGTGTSAPVIADDNRDASISDDGNVISFTSNQDLIEGGNEPGQNPREENDEIFTYVRSTNALKQITETERGPITALIINLNSTISGDGLRVAFMSNANDPVAGSNAPGNNADGNFEIFFTDLDASGGPDLSGRNQQITRTTRVNPGDIVNTFNFGRRMSRDGRYIAFDSFANLDVNGVSTSNADSFALYLFDATPPVDPKDTTVRGPAVRQIGPRSNADSGANGGDVNHYPGFTDYDVSGTPQTLVLGTRLNITAAGVIPATAADGLNPDPTRPTQVYSYDLAAVQTIPAGAPVFKRLTKLPAATSFIVAIQPLTTDSESRLAFNLGLSEVGTGNFDQLTEVYYLLTPFFSRQTVSNISFATGATRIPVSPNPVPTPSPTPTPSPSPSPTPTPQTPPAVQGVSPGMLAIVNYDSGFGTPIQVATAEGSLSRSFTLPIELSGVTMSINGVACGLKSVGRREITFVVPRGLPVSSTQGTSYPVVINNNGIVIKGSITLVTARPDIFTYSFTDIDGNIFNNRPRLFNATNRVLTREPFTVTTIKYRGGRRVPTVLRLYLTGVESAPTQFISIKIGNEVISQARILTGAVLREPGVYTVDFTLPPALDGAGNVPVIFRITFEGIIYESRLDDTAPFVRIL